MNTMTLTPLDLIELYLMMLSSNILAVFFAAFISVRLINMAKEK